MPETLAARPINPLLKLVLEIGPLAVFFVTFFDLTDAFLAMRPHYSGRPRFAWKCIAAKLTTEASSMFHCSYLRTSPSRCRAGTADLRKV